MSNKLVVVRPFGPYRRGDEITDADRIAEIEAGEMAGWVIRVLLPATIEHSNGGS